MHYLKFFEEFSVPSQVVFEAALLLKIDSNTKAEIKKLTVPEGLFPLPDDKLHITLTSIKNCKANKEALASKLPPIEPPVVKLGETTIAERLESGKKSFVVELANQEELKKFVDKIYEAMGLENPEPERHFHITIANNQENKKNAGFGDPFGSIGDIKKEDF